MRVSARCVGTAWEKGDASRVGSRLWSKKVITGIVGVFVLSSVLGGAGWWLARLGHVDSGFGTIDGPPSKAKQLTKQDTTAVGDNNLSRVQAKGLLQQVATKRSRVETVKIGDVAVGFKEFGETESKCYRDRHYAKLLEGGFVTVTPYLGERRPSGAYIIMCKVQFTDKVNPYLLGTQQGLRAGETEAKLKVADQIILEITGITRPSDMFGQTVAQVEFRYEYRPTQLGLLLGVDSRQPLGVQEGNETFVLYDDGWRVE